MKGGFSNMTWMAHSVVGISALTAIELLLRIFIYIGLIPILYKAYVALKIYIDKNPK